MVDLSGMGGLALGWATSLVFWSIMIVGLIVVFFASLKVRQSMRFKYPCIEIVSLGQGKVSAYVTKAGWFKKRKTFGGLLEIGGEQELICKDNKRKIFCASSIDYHEINGKRGLICKRKDDDPDVLVPLDEVEVKNLKLLVRIAPADYRDAAVDILEEKRKETMTWLEKNAPVIITIGLLLFALIALIIIFQFAKQESAAWRDYALGVKAATQAVASTTAP